MSFEPEGPAGPSTDGSSDLIDLLSRRVVGQPAAMQYIVPYIQMYQAGLAPPGRPAGIFLLLGPSGTGKTRTVEALAEVLHASEKNVLKINCGEFQAEHEVAKLIGAPPGYIGHRETQPMLTQAKLDAVTTAGCDMSLVLFDEIEKAAPSVTPLLLGILDKATLRLGDGSQVNFEKSLIFLTSNLGAREMMREMQPSLGFHSTQARKAEELASKLESIGLFAVRKRFSPEFVNRLDVVVTYQPLTREALSTILDQHIGELQTHVHTRLAERSFDIEVTTPAREFLLEIGTSTEYGARELKRTIHRHLTQPVAAMVATGKIDPGVLVKVDLTPAGTGLSIEPVERRAAAVPAHPTILVADDNSGLLQWLDRVLSQAGWNVVAAESVQEALDRSENLRIDAALLDYLLADGDGVSLGVRLQRRSPDMQVLIMTGLDLPSEEAMVCQRYGWLVLRKPFLAQDALNAIQARLRGAERKASAGR